MFHMKWKTEQTAHTKGILVTYVLKCDYSQQLKWKEPCMKRSYNVNGCWAWPHLHRLIGKALSGEEPGPQQNLAEHPN